MCTRRSTEPPATACQSSWLAKIRPRRHLLAAAAICWLVSGSHALIAQNGSEQLAFDVFEDRTDAVGVDFVNETGASGELYFPEIMGSGAGLFDYDNDGDLDLYFVQAGTLSTSGEGESGGASGQIPMDRLYRNDSVAGDAGEAKLRFVDVTEESGIRATGYGVGVAAGDYDADGFVDLYLTNFGANQLWRNRGDGTFQDVTEKAGAGDARWSAPATFFDYDNDGYLDLFIGNYADFRLAIHQKCFSANGKRDYCAPVSYRAEPDRLLHNQGDGTFEEVTLKSGLASEYGYALGTVAADFDSDGYLDLYVANDGVPNQLWHNQGDGRFENVALLAGCAVNAIGEPEAGMGVAVADYDHDGDLDLFVAHLTKETNTLYRNEGDLLFLDESARSGLGDPSWPFTAFGTEFLDVDGDGLLDLLTVNGAVRMDAEQTQGTEDPFAQHNQLFRNLGGGRFEEITANAGQVFQRAEVSRGAAFGDLDNDGDTDVVITNIEGPARVLINSRENNGSWLGLRLLAKNGLDVQGAVVGFNTSTGRTLWRHANPAGSYASANDGRALASVQAPERIESVVVRWLGGSSETWSGLETGGYTELHQGTGKAPGGASSP